MEAIITAAIVTMLLMRLFDAPTPKPRAQDQPWPWWLNVLAWVAAMACGLMLALVSKGWTP